MAIPTIYWIDADGADCETRCFDEHHALRLEESLAAEGLHYSRQQPSDAPVLPGAA